MPGRPVAPEVFPLVLHHPSPHYPYQPQPAAIYGPLSHCLPGHAGERGNGPERPVLRISGHRLFPGLSLHLPHLRLPGGPLGPRPPHGLGRGVVEPGHQPHLLGRLLPHPAAGPGGGGGGGGLLRHPIASLHCRYPAALSPGRAMGWFYVALPVGSALAYLVGGLLGSRWGWRPAFLVAGLPGLAMAALIWRLPEVQTRTVMQPTPPPAPTCGRGP